MNFIKSYRYSKKTERDPTYTYCSLGQEDSQNEKYLTFNHLDVMNTKLELKGSLNHVSLA